MAKGPTYRVPYRRRREGRTNYHQRRRLILSGLPRLVVRKSLKHMRVQVIKAEEKGDVVIASATSEELRGKYGWQAPCGNIPAAYLTGLICGFRAKAKGVNKAVLDVGLHKPSRGSRVFAALKGAVDSGIEIPHDESLLPDESVIMGENIKSYAELLSSDPELYKLKFSQYLSRGLSPENLTDHFQNVKEKIISSFSVGEKN